MRQLAGRVAVVTGAASGIGRATSELLARRGCALALVDVNAKGLVEVADAIRAGGGAASLHEVDVADREQMRALPEAVLAEHGAVHLLVNNAGVSVGAEFSDHSLEDFDWVVGVNFWGVVHGCKFFLPHLLEQEEAHIVNISSLFGIVGFPSQSSYSATKFAVRGFSESLSAELAASGVGVTVVHPGAIRTNIMRDSRVYDEVLRRRSQEIFDSRGLEPEVAAARIVRAVERGRLRLLIAREARLGDWLKRLFPALTERIIARSYRRMQNRERPPGG